MLKKPILIFLLIMTVSIAAYALPGDIPYVPSQDHLQYYRTISTNVGEHVSLCAHINGNVYISNGGEPDGYYSSDGTRLGDFDPDLTDMACGDDGLIYGIQGTSVVVYTSAGGFVRSWDVTNCGSYIAVASNLNVYVAGGAAEGGAEVKVYSSTGIFVKKWREPSYGATDIAVDSSEHVYLFTGQLYSDGHVRKYDNDGTLLKTGGSGYYSMHLTRDDLIWLFHEIDNKWSLYNTDLDLIGTYPRKVLRLFPYRWVDTSDGQNFFIAEYDPYGTAWIDSINVHKRGYRAIRTTNSPAIPLPVVNQVSQRPATTYVDIDYEVIDPDSASVDVGVLVFVDGGTSLNDVLIPASFVEGTVTNVGPGILPNEPRRLTWNAAADWSTNVADFNVEIFAKDENQVLDLHFLHIPSNSPDPELVINRSPLAQEDFLSVWFWNLATNDPAIALSNGTVYGTSGSYDGQILASSTSTTTNGIDFILERMNLRVATQTEVDRAKEAGTPGIVNNWTPRTQMGNLPGGVNEYGFDTENDGVWVVPQN